jgi:ubiquinol-cytochrome c reductase subunit 10
MFPVRRAALNLYGITTQTVRNWLPAGVTWVGVGAVGVVFMTDWKLILGKIPVIKNKFDDYD